MVLIWGCSWGFSCRSVPFRLCFDGGEIQRVSDFFRGYSEKVPIATGRALSYLEPNSQTMQKTGRGVYAQTVRHADSPAYLEPVSDSLQEPIGGRQKPHLLPNRNGLREKGEGDRVGLESKQAHAAFNQENEQTENRCNMKKNSMQPL